MISDRIKTIIFLIILLQVPLQVSADELVMGRVISVERDKGKVVLHLSEEMQTGAGAAGADITVDFQERKIPRDVRRGRVVRVWLKDGRTGLSFVAAGISCGRGCDRTGIRGRLRKAGGFKGRGMRGGNRGGMSGAGR